jgi:hypothetical protein
MATEKTAAKTKDKPVTCGLVMPISSLDGCTAEHWVEVKSIICEAIEAVAEPQFTVKLVSDADDVGVIQKRIVQNIYSSDIIVCDVSGKNPNVMFELGMRLAFDRPTVIVKDDKTDYAFDTGIIEHVQYPRDLRFSRIVTFKAALSEKVLATHRAATTNPEHSTFLKNFGKFQVANLTEAVVPGEKIMIEMMQELQTELVRMRRTINREPRGEPDAPLRVAIEAAIRACCATRDWKVKDLIASDMLTSDMLYDEIALKIKAPRYFPRYSDYKKAVDEVLADLVRSEDRNLTIRSSG